MYRYILKRLLFLIPTVLGVTLIIFAVMNITPGNPGRMILGANANAAEVEAVNQELGFYDPVLVRWARYCGHDLRIVCVSALHKVLYAGVYSSGLCSYCPR